jgi:hypothetical protein
VVQITAINIFSALSKRKALCSFLYSCRRRFAGEGNPGFLSKEIRIDDMALLWCLYTEDPC